VPECEIDIRFNSKSLDDLGTVLASVQSFVYDASQPDSYHNVAVIFGIDVIMDWNLLVNPAEQAIYIASRVKG
jgi:hypothetical protein